MLEALTSTADVDVQVSFDDGAVLQVLSGVHRVDDCARAGLVTQAVAGAAEQAACGRNRGRGRKRSLSKKKTSKTERYL